MSLEHRNGRVYYYRSRRVNGRVRREYAGAAEAALMYAKWDQIDRDRRDFEAWERATHRRRTDEALDAGARFDRLAERVFRAAMFLTGHCQHKRGEWRRARGVTPMATANDLGARPQNPTAGGEPDPATLAAVEAAGAGGRAALVAVRQLFKNPKQVETLGYAAMSARAALLGLVGGRDELVVAALVEQCDRQTRELLADSGPEPSAAEWMAAARVVNNWLAVHALEATAALRSSASLDQRLTQAERRLHASLKSLAVLRRLRQPVAVTQVNIAKGGPLVVNNGTGEGGP